MLSYALSRRERILLMGFGVLLLVPGLLIAALARPCPVVLTCAFLVAGLVLTLVGGVGCFLIPNALAFPPSGGNSETIAEPDQSITHVSSCGVRYARVRCGSEADMKGEMDFCSDCFAKSGQYHAVGCDLEQCPKCHGQMISCGCSIDELRAL